VRFSKVRMWLEMVIALCAMALGVLTIFWHDWIEALPGWDPDHHSGSVEWIVVVCLFAIAIVMGIAARHHWKLLTTLPSK
jgi:hypothetical protein